MAQQVLADILNNSRLHIYCTDTFLKDKLLKTRFFRSSNATLKKTFYFFKIKSIEHSLLKSVDNETEFISKRAENESQYITNKRMYSY